MVWPVQTHPAQSTGPESKRNSGDGGYFSLDFSFYRTALPPKWISGLARLRHFDAWQSPTGQRAALLQTRYSSFAGSMP